MCPCALVPDMCESCRDILRIILYFVFRKKMLFPFFRKKKNVFSFCRGRLFSKNQDIMRAAHLERAISVALGGELGAAELGARRALRRLRAVGGGARPQLLRLALRGRERVLQRQDAWFCEPCSSKNRFPTG